MKCEMMNESCMQENCCFWKECKGKMGKEQVLGLFENKCTTEYYTIHCLMKNNTKLQLATKFNNSMTKIDKLNNELLDLEVRLE